MANGFSDIDLLLKLSEKLRQLNDKTMKNEDLKQKIQFLIVTLDDRGYADNVAYTLHQEILSAPLDHLILRLQSVAKIVMRLQKTVSRNFEYWIPDTFEDIYEMICHNNDSNSKETLKALRSEWRHLFTNRTLYEIDCRLHDLDINWPFTKTEIKEPKPLVSRTVKSMLPPGRCSSPSPTKQPTIQTKFSPCGPQFSSPSPTSSDDSFNASSTFIASPCLPPSPIVNNSSYKDLPMSYSRISTPRATESPKIWRNNSYRASPMSYSRVNTNESPKILQNNNYKSTLTSSWDYTYKAPSVSSPKIITESLKVCKNNKNKAILPSSVTEDSPILMNKTYETSQPSYTRITPEPTESPNNTYKVVPPTFFTQYSPIAQNTLKQLPRSNSRLTPYTTESPKVWKENSRKSSSPCSFETSSNSQKCTRRSAPVNVMGDKQGRRRSKSAKFEPLELYKPPTVRRQTTETLLRRRSISKSSDKENAAEI